MLFGAAAKGRSANDGSWPATALRHSAAKDCFSVSIQPVASGTSRHHGLLGLINNYPLPRRDAGKLRLQMLYSTAPRFPSRYLR